MPNPAANMCIGNESLRPTDLELLFSENPFQDLTLGSMCFHNVSMISKQFELFVVRC